MFGSLGYIDNGRRPPHRSSQFMGSSGHPARRDMFGARRPEEMALAAERDPAHGISSNTVALMERRCIFLEDQDKRRTAEIADLRAKLAQAHVETVHATVVAPTVQVDEVEPMSAARAAVAAGTEVQLQYPMRRLRSASGATQVWMRRREIDAHIAAVSYSWLLLFEEADNQPDRVFVRKFR